MKSKIKEKIQRGTHSLGNSVESVGKKLQKNGYNKLGAKVEKMGDLIEHMGDQNRNKKTTKGRKL